MSQAYIVDAARTPIGRRNGSLSGWHPVDLAATMLDAIVDRTGIDPGAIDDVIMGSVTQAAEQATNIGRNAILASKLPDSVTGVTIDRQCGSSQQAIHFAAQAVMSGTQDVVIAAGIESMSRVPMGLNTLSDQGFSTMTASMRDRYGVDRFTQFDGAEMIAVKHGFSRDMLDAYALESHRRAAAATLAGAFGTEIVPIVGRRADGSGGELLLRDEGIRYDASLEGIGAVRLLREGGRITAATASQISDGASAALIVSEAALKAHGLTPIARIHNLTVTAGDPVIMLEEPLFATDKALHRAGLSIGDIDLYEVNEAFAPVPLAWLNHVDADPARLNVHGGAIAIGHPLGASGTRLMATLVHALRARGGRYGLQTMCEAGGQANVTIIEAL
jgi:acetyl-CoA C-acetyltransferase